jgi:uncharacterized membrane protein YuzA (DUF378 family)
MGQGGNCVVCKIVGLLVIIGALNWGLIGIWNYDLVVALLGNIPNAVRITYILVGLAGVLKLVSCVKMCPCCKTGGCSTSK